MIIKKEPCTSQPELEDGTLHQHNDVVESLNDLYRKFQDEFCKNQSFGQVSVVSKSHISCHGSKHRKTLTLPELYLLDTPEIQELRTFVTLLPNKAHFYIVHYPHSYDIFTIHWEDDN